MKKRTWDWLLVLHILLILWALLFFSSLDLADGGRLDGSFAGLGILAGLFLCIPLAIASLTKRQGGDSAKSSILCRSYPSRS